MSADVIGPAYETFDERGADYLPEVSSLEAMAVRCGRRGDDQADQHSRRATDEQ